MPAPQSTTFRQISETLHEPQSQTVDAICGTHGKYVSTVTTYDMGLDAPTVISSRCPGCAEDRRLKEEARKAEDAARERMHKVVHLFSRAGIPPRFSDRSFANYIATNQGQKIALSVCKAYADKWTDKRPEGASLVLTGAPGTGKTHLACAIASEIMQTHLAATLFMTVSAMLRSIKSTYRKDSERTEQEAISALNQPDLLILDEVGVQVGSEHEKLLMFEVLNERYQQMRPTILISNLAVDELEEFLGHRVMDRYRECGSVLAFDWQSHRGQR